MLPPQGFLKEQGHTNEDLLEAVKADQVQRLEIRISISILRKLLPPVNGMDGIGLPVLVHARVCPQSGDTGRRAPGDALGNRQRILMARWAWTPSASFWLH